MKIALSGYYGFDNAGDEALLSAITSSIKELAPEAEFVVFSGSPVKTTNLHGIKAIYYMNPFLLIKELVSADLLISGGGSIFQDVTSTRSLMYYISIVALAKMLGTPVMFYAQGVGPINQRVSRFLMRLVANKVDFITVRDMESGELLTRLGVTKPPRKITADPVFALKAEERDYIKTGKILAEINPEKAKMIGVSVRQWHELAGYRTELARLLDDLANDAYKIIFIPLAYPQDIAESEEVANLMVKQPYILNEALSSTEHIALIAQLDFLIGIRLHSLVFAAQGGIPFAGISYDPKVTAFLETFGQKPLSLDYPQMKIELSGLLNNVNLKEEIINTAQSLAEKSDENAKLALDLISHK
ncbi:MAG: polysaccharide pyruvyl transferase CsaB [Syntrophomonadaceae bacterium]|nr:polysaccharide pyruvyl transferase CsaB [Syntrophomonadaceae bacterium]